MNKTIDDENDGRILTDWVESEEIVVAADILETSFCEEELTMKAQGSGEEIEEGNCKEEEEVGLKEVVEKGKK